MKCIENEWDNVSNLIFQYVANIWCNIGVQYNCRAKGHLSFPKRLLLNPLSKFRENLKIKTFTIENVLKCMENVWEHFLNLIFQYFANIVCKIDIQQNCRALGGLLFC